MSEKSIPHPYPYDITPVECPPAAVSKSLNRRDVLEFFRVEALLRSERVMQLYEQTIENLDYNDPRTDTLLMKYAVYGGWSVVYGEHHCILFPDQMREIKRNNAFHFQSDGILDLSSVLNSPDERVDLPSEPEFLLSEINKNEPRYLWVRIDTA